MAVFNAKNWLRTQIKLYLTIIKAWVTPQVTTLQGQIDANTTAIAALGSITGAYKGSFATIAAMPTGAGVKNGDWSILNNDEVGSGTVAAPQYESGIYVRQTGAWGFVSDLQTFQEIRTELLATSGEAATGTSTLKVLTVLQTTDKIAAAIATIDIAAKADLAGSDSQTFLVSGGNDATDQAVNANQFGTISAGEAQADFDAS